MSRFGFIDTFTFLFMLIEEPIFVQGLSKSILGLFNLRLGLFKFVLVVLFVYYFYNKLIVYTFKGIILR